MKTLVVYNQKGGVGKTALVVNLAYYFAKVGLKVAVIDIDVQGNTSWTLENFASGITSTTLFSKKSAVPDIRDADANGYSITLIGADFELVDIDLGSVKVDSAALSFKTAVSGLDKKGFDICLIDTPGVFGIRVVSAMMAADYVLAPVELEAYSIKGVELLLRTIQHVVQSNDRLSFIGMVVNRMDRRSPRHVANFKELSEAYGDLVLPTTIGQRGCIAECLVSGDPIWTNKKTAARPAIREMQALAEHITKVMEIQK